jgi:urease accessory protein
MLDRLAPDPEPSPPEEPLPAPSMPAYVRADGGVRLEFARVGARTMRTALAESGGFRARFPSTFVDRCEAVLINTGGGMTGGDRCASRIQLGAGAQAVVTTQAAEKIYRSDGPETRVETRLQLEAGSSLHWLPQEAILFSRARLRRTLEADMAPDAALVACESLFFGRAAFGEALEQASLKDRWRIRRGGRLIFADDVRLEGPVDLTLRRPAVAAGARAIATVVVVAPDAAGRLDAARAALGGAASEWGASALDGMLVARLLSPDAAALRADLARLMIHLAGAALPRSWQL